MKNITSLVWRLVPNIIIFCAIFATFFCIGGCSTKSEQQMMDDNIRRTEADGMRWQAARDAEDAQKGYVIETKVKPVR